MRFQFPPVVAHTLEHLVWRGVSKAMTSGKEKNQVRINIQETHEHLECSNQVYPLPSQGRKGMWRMPVTNLETNLWINWLISATRFGELAGIPYSRWGRTKTAYNGMKTDFERSPYIFHNGAIHYDFSIKCTLNGFNFSIIKLQFLKNCERWNGKALKSTKSW